MGRCGSGSPKRRASTECPLAGARHVIDNPVVTLTLPAPEPGIDDRLVFLGGDPTGRALEVGAIRLPDCLLVIHVQDLRAKVRPYYDQAREEQ